MIDLKFFPRLTEFDSKTNQVKLTDEEGLIWIAPLPYTGVLRDIPLDTPCILIQWGDGTRSMPGFPEDGRVRLHCVAIPIYNSTRIKDKLTKYPVLVGEVSDDGRIVTKVTATSAGVEMRSGSESLIIDDMTHLGNVELGNADVSYGGIGKPQFFPLRYRPDFPYLLPEILPDLSLLKFARRLVSITAKLRT